MTTIAKYVDASSDDGYCDGSNFNASDSDQLKIGYYNSVAYTVFLRFPDINIPRGSVITNAYITLTAESDQADHTVSTGIYNAEEDNADAPTSLSEFNNISWSYNYVVWNWPIVNEGNNVNSSDISTRIQAVVSRTGWSSGNAILLGIFPLSSTAGRTAYPYEFGSNYAKLTVTYSDSSFIESIEDSFEGTIEISDNYLSLMDSLSGTSSVESFAELVLSLSEEFDLADLFGTGFSETLSDSLTGYDAFTLITLFTQTLSDSFNAADTLSNSKIIIRSIIDSLFMWDQQTSQWQLNISDSVNGADSHTIYLLMLWAEYLTATDAISSNYNGTDTLSDSVNIKDSILSVICMTLNDALNAADSFSPILTLMFIEYITAKDVAVATGTFTNEIADTVAATDSMVSQWLLSMIDSFAGADVASQIKSISETLAENVTISDVLSNTGAFKITIEESARIVEILQNAYGLSLSDSLAGADTFTSFADLYNTLTESMAATDAMTATLTAYLSLSDSAVLVETLSSNGVFYNTISEAIQLNVLVEIDSGIYECWVLNTPQFLPSVYSGFDFNSYAVFNNRIFAANSTGIFELTGSTDNGTAFHTGVQLQETDFDSAANKRIRAGFLGLSGTTPVMSMEATDTDIKRTYSISDKGVVSAARDVVGKKWKLSVMDFDTLDTIKLVPIVLTKRR